MDKKFIIAHDMGTSANKAVLFTIYGEIAGTAKEEYAVSHPRPGWAEQNPADWWHAVCRTTRHVLKKAGVQAGNVVGITFSSQTQSLISMDGKGRVLRPAIIWLDGRSADIIRKKVWIPPRIMGYNPLRVLRFIRITGGSPGHTGKDQIGKLLWLREYEPEVFHQAAVFLDAKDYLIYKLTGKKVTSTDLAYIWWLLDTRNKRNQWHRKLCAMAGVEPQRLAEVKPSSAIVGPLTREAAREMGLKADTPVINGAGDLSASALGSGAILEGEQMLCLGTSGWVGGHYSRRRVDIPHYTGCIGSALPDRFYLGMAHQETVGICLEWLKNKVLYHEDQLKKEHHTQNIFQVFDELADNVRPGSEGLMFTPWMYGERCPIDDDHVRAGLFNIGLNHSREHIVRAVFEGIAFNLRWAMQTLDALYWKQGTLRIVGGGSNSNVWCQIVSDVLNRVIERVCEPQQAGARGVALLASMALGYIDSLENIRRYIQIDRRFTPDSENRSLYDRLFAEFKNLYRQNRKWYARMNSH